MQVKWSKLSVNDFWTPALESITIMRHGILEYSVRLQKYVSDTMHKLSQHKNL